MNIFANWRPAFDRYAATWTDAAPGYVLVVTAPSPGQWYCFRDGMELRRMMNPASGPGVCRSLAEAIVLAMLDHPVGFDPALPLHTHFWDDERTL